VSRGRTRGPVAAAALVACIGAGCGGGGEKKADVVDSSVVRRALTQTTKQIPFAVAYRGEVRIGEKRAPYSGEGLSNPGGLSSLNTNFTKVAPLFGQSAKVAPDWKVEQIIGDPYMWVKSGRLTEEFDLGGRPWGRLSTRIETRDPVLNPMAMLATADLAMPLDPLRAIERRAERHGKETVRGAPATRYRVRVDLARYGRIAQRTPVAQPLKAPGGGPKLDLEIWIDEQGVIARVAYTAATADGRGTVSVSEELFDFYNEAGLSDGPYEYEETDLSREQRKRSRS
jgi:hypothetical protein